MPRWNREWDHLLGTMSDEALAERVGVSRTTVQCARIRADVDAFCPRYAWKSEWDALLGTMPDVDLARQVGVTAQTVLKHREAAGVEPFQRRVEWNHEWDALLGTASDGELAKRFGVSTLTVCKHRNALGIEPYWPPSQIWDPANDHLLGTAPDNALALRLGVATTLVKARRRALSIGAYALTNHRRSMPVAPDGLRRVAVRAFLDMNPIPANVDMAKALGVSRERVRQIRAEIEAEREVQPATSPTSLTGTS